MIRSILSLIATAILLEGCRSEEVKKTSTPVSAIQVSVITGLAEIQPEQKIIPFYSITGGTVSRVYHELGDTVKKGEILATLDTKIETAQLKQAIAKLATQDAVINGSGEQLAALKVQASSDSETYARNVQLYKSGSVTRKNLDNSMYENETARQNVLTQLQTIHQGHSRMAELNADVNYSEAILDQKSIRAPYDGTILSIDVKVGSTITANQSLGQFAPAGRLVAITEIDELYAARVRKGMKACILPQGQTDTLATGTVYLLSPSLSKKSLFSDGAANLEDRRVREVRVMLDSGAKVIIGNRVNCAIQLK